ncbi:MAG TPA: RluA family pseudouridine synthase [Verrucomicrobiales bacterium]|nr:RluA family pseudouridine synthase [Verrucomicrobiales bacterium]
MQAFQLEIDLPSDAGQRLDQVLARHFPDLSRSRLQQLIRSGSVSLNDQPARPKDRIKLGDRIALSIPEPEPSCLEPEPIALRILHDDPHFLVVDKDAGLVVHPGAGNRRGTLVHALLHHFPNLSAIGGVERPGIVHRLDRDTSGCLVVARDDLSHRRLAAQFSAREVRKIYLAVVAGTPLQAAGRIDLPIARHPVHRQRMSVAPPGHGRSAITGFRLGPSYAGATLVVCKLLTGRTHQIRVHLHHIGHPILGDPIYGRGILPRYPSGSRLLLHAWILGFRHPLTGEEMEFRSPIPPDFHPWTNAAPPPEFP